MPVQHWLSIYSCTQSIIKDLRGLLHEMQHLAYERRECPACPDRVELDRAGWVAVWMAAAEGDQRLERDPFDAERGGVGANAHVIVVYFAPPQTITIGKGENDGRSLTYWNAVSDIQTAGMWHGKAQRYELPMSEITKKGGCAVLLQAVDRNGLPGPIIGAAVVRKPTL